MFNLVKFHKFSVQLFKQSQLGLCSAIIKPKLDLNLKHNYSGAQTKRILQIINVNDEAELTKYNISKQRIKRIELRKEKMGYFTKLEQILELDGFGIKVFEKFCDSILETKEDSDQQKAKQVASAVASLKKPQFINPILHESVRKSVKTCVSLNLGLDNIAWTKFRLNFADESNSIKYINVEDWDSYPIDEEKKLNLPDLIQIMSYVNRQIPEADVYVLEALPSISPAKQPGNAVQVNINVQKYQSIAMLSVLLANRKILDQDDILGEQKKKLNSQQVFFLKNYLSSKLFKVFIGNEKVSTESIVSEILRYNYMEGESTSGDRSVNGLYLNPMDVPQDLRIIYNDANRVKKEYLGQSLLIGLTFIKLCVIKCTESLNFFNRSSRIRSEAKS